jgi:hypothetical protein
LKSAIEEAEALLHYAGASLDAINRLFDRRRSQLTWSMAPILQVPPASAHDIVFVTDVVTGQPLE